MLRRVAGLLLGWQLPAPRLCEALTPTGEVLRLQGGIACALALMVPALLLTAAAGPTPAAAAAAAA